MPGNILLLPEIIWREFFYARNFPPVTNHLISMNDHPSTPLPLSDLLAQAIDRVASLGPEFDGDAQKMKALKDRLGEQRFHLAVLGQFKRGKSTMLNALLGVPLLPASVTPLTAIPTFLSPGPSPQIRIRYEDRRPDEVIGFQHADDLTHALARYVTEEGNPHNRLGVKHVEVSYPAPLLEQGVVLIDTPGIGSTLRHNTEVTLSFLPQCDAALFLISADPPLTEVEVAFLKEVRTKVARIFFILNKVDYLNPDEQQQVITFLAKTLREQAGVTDPGPIFSISARQGLQARRSGDQQLWERSGMAELEAYLVQFLVSDKIEVLQTAMARKAADRLTNVLMRLHLTIRSLQLPLADLDARQALFAQKLAEAEREKMIAQDLLTGDHKRLVALLEEQADSLRQRTRDYFNQVVDTALAQNPGGRPDEEVAQEALAAAIPDFFERELSEMSRAFEQRVNDVLEPHRQRANALVQSVQRGAAEIFEIAFQPLDASDAFALENQPYWVTYDMRTTISPFSPELTDRLLPARIRRQRRRARLQEKIETLVIRNVENLRWATRQNLDQAMRRFSARLDDQLAEAIAATQNAIQAARRQRQEQSDSVTGVIARLEQDARDLERIQAQMQALSSPTTGP